MNNPWYSRFQQVGVINLTTPNASYTLPTQGGLIPSDKWLLSMQLRFEGRMTNPGANGPTGVLADAPYSLIESVCVKRRRHGLSRKNALVVRKLHGERERIVIDRIKRKRDTLS